MRSAVLASGLFAFFVVTSLAGVILLAMVPAAALSEQGDSFWLSVCFVLVLGAFGVVGLVVARHQPRNPVGWLFLALAGINGAFEVAHAYTHYSLAVASLPGTSWAAWFSAWSSEVSPALIGLSVLVFPDGQLVSRRWRPAAWFCLLGMVPVIASYALVPGPMTEFPSVENPLGTAAFDFLRETPVDLVIALILLLATASIIVRLRRSRGVERQQVKWFAWSGGLIVGFLLVSPIVVAIGGAEVEASPAGKVAGVVFAVILAGLPISAGIAILRYRLYDIDRLIGRTLVYGSLTAALLATYLVSVLLLQVLLRPLAGESDLAVAASTLAVAALFRPLRSAIQRVVDRRFFRHKYDATRTVESFAGRLRQEVDLDTVSADLRDVVRDTVQPAHLSLWLRSTVRTP